MERCLYCYQELAEGETDFHSGCPKKIFGSAIAPILPYTRGGSLSDYSYGCASKTIARHIIVGQRTQAIYHCGIVGALYPKAANGIIQAPARGRGLDNASCRIG